MSLFSIFNSDSRAKTLEEADMKQMIYASPQRTVAEIIEDERKKYDVDKKEIPTYARFSFEQWHDNVMVYNIKCTRLRI